MAADANVNSDGIVLSARLTVACGLAGGTWDRIDPLIQEELAAKGIPVVVYDFAA